MRTASLASEGSWRRLAWWALALALLAVAQLGTFHWMVRYRWFHADGLYQHAPLLLAFGVWQLWRERRGLTREPRASCGWGMALLGGGLFLHLAGVLLYRDSVSGFALIPILAGMLLAVEGPGRTRRLLPILLLLLFLVPLPDPLLKGFTFPMKMAATRAGAGLAGLLLGEGVWQRGTEIFFPGQAAPLLVGDACSGMRSALALLTLSYCLAFFFGPPGARRWVLLILALPVAFLANSFRIAALALVAHHHGVATATGAAHDLLNYGIYLVALVLLLLVDAATRALTPRREGP